MEYPGVHPDNITSKVLEAGQTTFPSVICNDTPVHSPGVLVDLGYGGDFFDADKSRAVTKKLVQAADLLRLSPAEGDISQNASVIERAEKISEYLLWSLASGKGGEMRGKTATGDQAAKLTFAGTSDWVRTNGAHWGDISIQMIRADHSREPWQKGASNRVVFGLFHASQQLLYGDTLRRFENILDRQLDKTNVHPTLVDDPVVPNLPNYILRDTNAPPYNLNQLAKRIEEIGQNDDRFTHKPLVAAGNVARGELRHASGIGLDVVLSATLPPEFRLPVFHQEAEGVFTVAAQRLVPGGRRNEPPKVVDVASVSDPAVLKLVFQPWVEVAGERCMIDDSRMNALDRPRWGAAQELGSAARVLLGAISTERKMVRGSGSRAE